MDAEEGCCTEAEVGVGVYVEVEEALFTALLAAEGGNADWECGCVSHSNTSAARKFKIHQRKVLKMFALKCPFNLRNNFECKFQKYLKNYIQINY